MADLKKNNETIILPTQRDSLKIRVKEEDKGMFKNSFLFMIF